MIASLLFPVILVGQAQSNPPKSLADYLPTAGFVGYVAVAPRSVRPTGEGVGLAAYGRKAVRLGTINAIVPATTVAFDDDLTQPPNLYDGLPRAAKALYLLTLLDADQQTLAAGRGLALDDLHGEARAVFASLLPKSIDWRETKIGGDGAGEQDVAAGTVDGTAMGGVRLQVVRTLSLFLPLADEADSTMQVTTTLRSRLTEGSHLTRLIAGDDDRQGDTLFGLPISRTVDNLPKRGDLDTRRLGGTVTLMSGANLGEALALAGRASGLEIVADARVRGLTVATNAGAVRAGDLLDALALAVGGAYRRVASVYLLTADVRGLGARQLRLAAWDQGIREEVERRQVEWQHRLGRNGALDAIGYDPGDPLAPDARLRGLLQPGVPGYAEQQVPEDALTPALREFIDAYRKMNPTERVRTDHVGIEATFGYRFVLPDGRPLSVEYRELGLESSFVEPRTPRAVPKMPSPPAPVALPPDGGGASVLFRAETADAAMRATREARAHGVREILLETSSPEALRAAIGPGLSVRLAVRPFAGGSSVSPESVDRTILGDDGEALTRRLSVAKDGTDYRGGSPVALRPVPILVAPAAAEWPTRLARIAALARTPGLKGVVIVDSEPHGEEGKRSNGWSSNYPPTLIASTAFGYTERARSAFLRTEGVDPIDLGWSALGNDVDLRPPFFPDDALMNRGGGRTRMPEVVPMALLTTRWDAVRAEANRRALDALLGVLPEPSVEIEARATDANAAPSPVRLLVAVRRGEPLPNLPEDPSVIPTHARRLAPPLEEAYWGALPLYERVTRPTPEPNEAPTILDLSSVPMDRWSAMLDRAFAPIGG